MQEATYTFFDKTSDITGYLESLRSERAVAIDLEADSLYNYREKICLAQISTPSANTILDPLACRSAFAGLGALLASPTTEKVFHGGDYDIRLLKKDYGFPTKNVFDTAIAAQFTGRTRFGLANLLEEFFGVLLDKKYQRADWSTRPLAPELLAYAALDTAYLLHLRARLQEELQSLGRLEWVQEEFRLLEAVTPAPTKSPSCLDMKGACRLSPRQLAVLQALLEVRDAAARQWDRPPFKVLSNAVLLAWTQSLPKNREELMASPGASKRVLARLAEQILEAMKRAQALPPERCPRPAISSREPLQPAQGKRLERLKRVRGRAVERLGLPPGLVVNTATLERLARKPPDQAASCVKKQLKTWQMEAVGTDLIHALQS